MTLNNVDDGIKAVLATLKQAGLKERQHVIAWCADKPQRFGAEFFSEILRAEADSICKWYAIRALGNLRANHFSELLVDVLRQPDVEIGESSLHRICARSIGLLGSKMVPRIVSLLKESSAAIRLAAVDTLGEIGHHSAIPALSLCLTLSERDIQLWAALSLGKIGVESISALVSALSSASKKEVMIFLDALVMINTPRVIDVVADTAKKHPDVVRFYFTGDRPERAEHFLKMLQEVVSSSAPEKDKAVKILSLLKSKKDQHSQR